MQKKSINGPNRKYIPAINKKLILFNRYKKTIYLKQAKITS